MSLLEQIDWDAHSECPEDRDERADDGDAEGEPPWTEDDEIAYREGLRDEYEPEDEVGGVPL